MSHKAIIKVGFWWLLTLLPSGARWWSAN
jgi:hypothetical protein